MLNVENLTIKKSKNVLCRDLSFCLRKSQVLELNGSNGSGKTSLLRVIAGISPQFSGIHNSKNFNKMYIPSFGGMREELTTIEVTKSFLDCDYSKAVEALSRLGLEHKLNSPIYALSEGQRRRVMIARIRYSPINLLLIDEPFNALDSSGKKEFFGALHIFCEKGGIAIIATHISVKAALQVVPISNDTINYCLPSIIISLGENSIKKYKLIYSQELIDKKVSKNENLRNNTLVNYNNEKNKLKPILLNKTINFLIREKQLVFYKPGDFVWPIVFLWMLISIIPLAIGYDTSTLKKIAPGVFYTNIFLVMAISSSRLFEPERDSGSLEQIFMSNENLTKFSLAKGISNWILVGIPLSLFSILLASQYSMESLSILTLTLSLIVF